MSKQKAEFDQYAPDRLVLVAHPDFDPDCGVIETRFGSVSLPTAVGDPDAYAFRVAVSPNQSVVGFPKFGTIGIGFAEEDDWNTNLPYTVPAEETADHIGHNRVSAGDETIPRATVVAAINLIREGAGRLDQYGVKCRACVTTSAAALRKGEPDPNSDLHPHWVEDCPRYPVTTGSFRQPDAPRDADGWLIEDEDDE